MVYKPRQIEVITSFLEERLKNNVHGITNFAPTSFNRVWSYSFSERFRETEVSLLAAQLSGWIEYSGGPLDEADLESLGISDEVTPEEINEYMEDEDLDKLVRVVGIERSPGQKAEGEVTFTTVSSPTTIPEETLVGTTPDASGNFNEFETTEEVSTGSGETEVTASIISTEYGGEDNVGGGTITYLPNPPTGVTSVINDVATDGGRDAETNEELRDRAKDAIFTSSGGGTAAGVEGYVLSNTEDVASVTVQEYPGGNDSTLDTYDGPGGPGDSTSTTPFADVIVEGGDPTDAEENIEASRPVAIQHNLVRPAFLDINISVEVTGENISTDSINDVLEAYLGSLGLGDNLYRDKVIQLVMNADDDIESIETLTISVDDEGIIYDSDNSEGDAPNHPLYKLRKGDDMEANGITEVTGTLSGSSTAFTEDTDYDEGTVDGSDHDAIDWGIGGDNPDEDTEFYVTYTIKDDMTVTSYEKARTASISATVV